jgi:C-terminal processing protease CtpA/Prc
MRPFLRLSVLAFALIVASPLIARDLTAEERLADFEQLVGMVRASYGMLEYKQKLLKIDFTQISATYRAKVQTVANDNAFYDLLSAFLSELKDAHVGHFRPSNARASLGFSVERIEEKAIITDVNRKVLPEEQFPFHEGDELVAIDGKPVARIVQEMVPMHASSTEESSLGLMTRSLTMRAGWLGPVPTGVAKLDIRPVGATENQQISTPWIVRGKFLPGLSFHSGEAPDQLYPLRPGTTSPDNSRNPIAGAFDSQIVAPWMPADAQVLESKYYGAALFNTEKGLMGYLRIPTFSVENDEEAVLEFRKLLGQMRFTKGLVLDLNDNPGGSLFYCYKLASMFASKPLALPMVSERASRTNLSSYQQWAEGEEAAVTKQLYELAADAMRKAMEANQDMTEFMYSFGVATQVPDEVTYAQPVLMLINDQCYSCGDIFPALLKDNGRATLMGSTTAGAGGAVGSFGPLAYSGSSINLTLNLMKRVDGTFIENVGVAPDIQWQHTQVDVASGYESYRQAYTAELLKLVP